MKEEIVRLRVLGEAHLYVGMAKADGKITTEERADINYYARKCEGLIDLLGIGEMIRKKITGAVKEILSDPKNSDWGAYDHLDESINLLKEAKKIGDHSVHLIVHKHEQGLSQVAASDSYLYVESSFLREVKTRFLKLKD